MMRIAHFLIGRCNPESSNGVEKTVYYLCKTQAKLGNNVVLFSLTEKPPIPIQGVGVRTYPPSKFPFKISRQLLNDLLKYKPNIVHLHSVYTPQNAALARWLVRQRIPYVVTPNGGLSPFILKRRWYLKVPYKYFFEQPLLNHSQFIHSVGANDDIRGYGVHAPIIEVPNGIDLATIPRIFNNSLLASRFPQVKGKRIFLFLGRLDPIQKGLDLLLKGFAKAELKGALLVLVGPDWRGSRKKLENLSRALGIYPRVIFAGPIYGKEKFDMVSGADVFVHTSRWEGVPFSVLEAAAVGLPCLVTPAADPLSKLSSNRCAILVHPDVQSISVGFREFVMLGNSQLKIMGRKAQDIIKTDFDWRKIASTILEAYGEFAAEVD